MTDKVPRKKNKEWTQEERVAIRDMLQNTGSAIETARAFGIRNKTQVYSIIKLIKKHPPPRPHKPPTPMMPKVTQMPQRRKTDVILATPLDTEDLLRTIAELYLRAQQAEQKLRERGMAG